MKLYKVWTSDLSAPILLVKAENQAEAMRSARKENHRYDLIEECKAENKCPHFRKNVYTVQRDTPQGKRHVIDKIEYRCMGAKWAPLCHCKGNKDKCDFRYKF